MRVGKLVFSLVIAAVTLAAQPGAAERIDLAKLLDDGKLRPVNREVSKIVDRAEGVHISKRADPGIMWIDGIDFGEGDLEVEIRGRDRYQQSFVGVACIPGSSLWVVPNGSHGPIFGDAAPQFAHTALKFFRAGL